MIRKYILLNNTIIKYELFQGIKNGMFEIDCGINRRVVGFIINRYFSMNWYDRITHPVNIIDEYFSICIRQVNYKPYYYIIYQYMGLQIYIKFTWMTCCYRVLELKIRKVDKYVGFKINIEKFGNFEKTYNCNYPERKKNIEKIRELNNIGRKNKKVISISKFVYNIYKKLPKYNNIDRFIKDNNIIIPFREYF